MTQERVIFIIRGDFKMARTRMLGTMVLTAFFAILVCAALYIFNMYMQDTSVIENIKALQKSPNVFMDVDDSIGVSSAADIGYIVDSSGISLHYGNQIIDIKRKSLKNADFMELLKSIGIEFWYHEDEMRVTYWGDEVTEWTAIH